MYNHYAVHLTLILNINCSYKIIKVNIHICVKKLFEYPQKHFRILYILQFRNVGLGEMWIQLIQPLELIK